MYTLEKFHGAQNGWYPASFDSFCIDKVTAERRLKLYQQVRGFDYIFRIVPCHA